MIIPIATACIGILLGFLIRSFFFQKKSNNPVKNTKIFDSSAQLNENSDEELEENEELPVKIIGMGRFEMIFLFM